jgi:succinate dehydrogenase/fumarate reductase flavoprotein subunit
MDVDHATGSHEDSGAIEWDRECDVVVLGSGGAGLSAAVTAAAGDLSVIVFEKAATVGGTTAVSGGIVWVPAHERDPAISLPVEDALLYLKAQSFGVLDEDLVETFIRTAPEMVDFMEVNTGVKFEVAAGYPDYKPELPGGKPGGGRSLSPLPYDLSRLGLWRDRITVFPDDYSNVGFDAETRARLSPTVGADTDDLCVAGTALVAGLLKGLLHRGVVPETNSRATDLIAESGRIVGVRVEQPDRVLFVRARRGVIVATGGFEWDQGLVTTFLRGPMHGAVSPPNNTGDGLRMAMAHGCALGNMGEAWWVPIVRIPGDLIEGHPRSRSVRLERTRPRSIIVNRFGRRFVNEAGEYNAMAGAFHYLDPAKGFANDPAWIVFDSVHLKRYGFLGVEPGGEAPDWFHPSASLPELAEALQIDAAGLTKTVASWNDNVAHGVDPDFGRGSSAYDGYWGDREANTVAGQTLGPIDQPPFHAVLISIGAMGTKGGLLTDDRGRVQHVKGGAIPGLYAAGNAMAGVTGKAYGGAGGTIAPGMVWGFLAARDLVHADPR